MTQVNVHKWLPKKPPDSCLYRMIFKFYLLIPIEICAKMPVARGCAVIHSMENRWQGRAEMTAWKKRGKRKRDGDSRAETHWDPAERSTYSPSKSRTGECTSQCVFVSVEMCLSACSRQSRLHVLVCVWRGKPSSAGHHTVRTGFCRAASWAGAVLFKL